MVLTDILLAELELVPISGPPWGQRGDPIMELKERFWQLTQERFGRAPDQCDDGQLYEGLLLLTQQMAQSLPAPDSGRKLYYFSAEFLMGKLLSNNLLALGLYDPVKKILSDLGRDLGIIESMEPEPSLGNGRPGPVGCLLSGLYRRLGAAWGRGWTQLPLWPVPAEVRP